MGPGNLRFNKVSWWFWCSQRKLRTADISTHINNPRYFHGVTASSARSPRYCFPARLKSIVPTQLQAPMLSKVVLGWCARRTWRPDGAVERRALYSYFLRHLKSDRRVLSSIIITNILSERSWGSEGQQMMPTTCERQDPSPKARPLGGGGNFTAISQSASWTRMACLGS